LEDKKVKATLSKICVLLLCLCQPIMANACRYNVRDVGFVQLEPSPYYLYCYVSSQGKEKPDNSLSELAFVIMMDSNVVVENIDVDTQAKHEAMKHYRQSGLDKTPAAILVSQAEAPLQLPLTDKGVEDKEAIWDAFEGVITSPVREKILQNIVQAYCVILLIESEDDVKNASAREVADEVSRKIGDVMDRLPKAIDQPPTVIVIPHATIEKEKVLLWSLGYKDNSDACVAVLYGRGRRMGNLLYGDEINSAGLYSLLSMIGLSCECGLDRSWLQGIMMPLRWDEEAEAQVARILGFDAGSPAVKTEISQILGQSAGKHGSGKTGDLFFEYSEGILNNPQTGEEEVASAVALPTQITPVQNAVSAPTRPRLMLIVIAVLGALVIVASGVIVLLAMKRS
jgi:hypothetical protein